MKYFVITVLCFAFLSSCTKKKDKQPPSLKQQLEDKAEAAAKKTPTESKKIMQNAIDQLKENKVVNNALKVGDSMPDFVLEDVEKGSVDTKKLRHKGPLIVTFYRGGWCPYCNLQLRDLQKHLSEIKKTGAQLIAITPEKPDATAKTVKKQDLGFYVLSDTKGKVIDEFGLSYKLDDELIGLYKKFGIHLNKTNGTKKWKLPLAATYIVDQEGYIIYAFVDADYKKRAETTRLIEVLKSL